VESINELPNGSGVISYSVNGKQYTAVAAGMKSGLWSKPSTASKVIIYGLLLNHTEIKTTCLKK
jgi:hypothetical protein